MDLFRPHLAYGAARAAARVLTPDPETGRAYIGRGRLVDRLEAELAVLLETEGRPVLALSSGTAAIDLALHLCGLTPERAAYRPRVITTPMTCAATNVGLVHRGAHIVWADVDPLTGCIDPASVARLVRHHTHIKAVIAVDWAGRACDYNALRVAAPGIPIIQDAAHSLLGTHNGRYFSKVGGDYQCYSFGPIKHLSAPNGGALVCPPGLDDRARLLSWYGLDRRSKQDFRCEQDITEAGHKYLLSDVDAAVLLENLPHVPGLVHRHRQNALAYSKAFAGLPGITVPEYDPGSSYWVYGLLTERRDEFVAFLAERGIQASQVHRRNDTHPAFAEVAVPLDRPLKGLDFFAERQVNIPCGWWLSEKDVAHVIAAVTAWSGHVAA